MCLERHSRLLKLRGRMNVWSGAAQPPAEAEGQNVWGRPKLGQWGRHATAGAVLQQKYGFLLRVRLF